MPTYEYLCNNCGHKFEQFQGITSRPLRKCPKCKKPELKRLIGSGAGIIFKGSGFYQTDYRSDSYKQAQKKEKAAADSGTSDSKSKTKDKSSEKKTAETAKTKDNKKTAPVRIALPFQTIETVNESAQQRQKTLDLFAASVQK